VQELQRMTIGVITTNTKAMQLYERRGALPFLTQRRNRDTAWYAITDEQWPAIRRGFEAWLTPENMDGEGHQRQSLGELIDQARR
jgi:hypothetical protein